NGLPAVQHGQTAAEDRRGGGDPVQRIGLLSNRLPERVLQGEGQGRQGAREQLSLEASRVCAEVGFDVEAGELGIVDMIQGKCPICEKAFTIGTIDELPSFPFCSDRCKLIDLGRWIDGDYAIPGTPGPEKKDDEPPDEDEE